MKNPILSINYLKFNFLAFLLVFLLSCPTIFTQRVYAGLQSSEPEILYSTAWAIINEKYYFKSNVDLEKWKNKFSYKINDFNEAHKCIDKLVKELNDPYTRFLTKEEFEEEQNIINSNLIGIGVKLASKKPIVLDVLPGSSASESGIKKNDLILAINGNSTKSLNIKEVIALMRGPKDSSITVQLKRDNETFTKEMIRKEIRLKTVSAELLNNNIVLLKIDSLFPLNTSNVFKNEAAKFLSMSNGGLILDLRDNAGGLVSNAVEIADMFLDQGKIVSTVNDSGVKNEYANSNQLLMSNIVILVNENTASASEILAGALRENNRAILIGERTFGKGLVQEIVKLPDNSALHVTVAAYLTPSGRDINKVGLIPDEIVYGEEKQLQRAKDILLRLKKKEKAERIALN